MNLIKVSILTAPPTGCPPISLPHLEPPYSLRDNIIEIRPTSDTTMAYKCPNIKRSPTYLTLNQKLEIIKVSEKWMSRVKTGQKLGLLHQSAKVVKVEEKLLKEIRNCVSVNTQMVRMKNSFIADT